ncbi:MAG: hypothetical protein M3O82_01510 [Verrucomicrobiota bacterium]|nr:hypothetical protein [Verrucomicrobiota bacterium]
MYYPLRSEGFDQKVSRLTRWAWITFLPLAIAAVCYVVVDARLDATSPLQEPLRYAIVGIAVLFALVRAFTFRRKRDRLGRRK